MIRDPMDLITLNRLECEATQGYHEAAICLGEVKPSVFVAGHLVARFENVADARLYAAIRNQLPELLKRFESLLDHEEARAAARRY